MPAQANKLVRHHFNRKKLGMVHVPVIPAMVGRVKQEDHSPGQPYKHEALSSNPSTVQNK
jgi:hypothetical protein